METDKPQSSVLTEYFARRSRFEHLLASLPYLNIRPGDWRFLCPCCAYPTLHRLNSYEMCPVCEWEEDGQGDAEADEVWGGPNAEYSLTAARKAFADSGGHGGMYWREHERDYARVQDRWPQTERRIALYAQMLAAGNATELLALIRQIEDLE